MDQTLLRNTSIPKAYFSLALPTVLSMVVTIVYNMADTFFIAQTQNADLVAGVSLCAPVFTLLMAFGNIFGQGGCSLISRLLGRKDEDGIRCVSAFCFYAALLAGAASGLVMLLLRTPLLTLLGANADSISFASDYFVWLAIGAPFVVVSFIQSNLLCSVGRSTQSMIGSVSGSLVNIILDPILISVCGLGAAGAAIATVIGYIATDTFDLLCMVKKCPQFSLHPAHLAGASAFAGQIFGVGIPAALVNLAQSFSMVLVNQALLAYGNNKIAAMGIALKVHSIAFLILVGFSFGGQPLIGYLYGAKDRVRLSELVSFCFRFICGLAAALTLVLTAAAPLLMKLFLNDPVIVSDGTLMLRLQAAGMVFAAVVQIIMILFQATGKTVPAFFLSVSRQGIVFVAVLAVAVRLAGCYGVIAAQAAADLLTAAIAVGLYFTVLRRELSGQVADTDKANLVWR